MSIIFLKRTLCFPNSTFGQYLCKGQFLAFSLEDPVREPYMSPDSILDREAWVKSWKIPKQTAIPRGRYPLVLSFSQRFQKVMLEVQNVPGFTGVRVHGGNDSNDTEGCPLAGLHRDLKRKVIFSCEDAIKILSEITKEEEPTWLDVS